MAQTAGTQGYEHRSSDIDSEVARLYELYADRILGYCLYRLGNRTEAEDAVQTTFMYAFRGLQRGVVPEVESAWLFTIAHNVCRSTRRSTRRRGRVESQQDPQLLQELSPGVERDNDSLLGLEDALASIPENQRRAILLREWQGMSYREIAAALGLTQTAVEMLVFRARRSLAAALEGGRTPAERRGVARILDLANLLSGVKSFFGGMSAGHVAAAGAAAAVVVAAGGAAPVRAAKAPATNTVVVTALGTASAEVAPARASRPHTRTRGATHNAASSATASGTPPAATASDAAGAPPQPFSSAPADAVVPNAAGDGGATPASTPAPITISPVGAGSIAVPGVTTSVTRDGDAVSGVAVDVQQTVAEANSAVKSALPTLP